MMSQRHTIGMENFKEWVRAFLIIYDQFHKGAKVFGTRIVKEDVFPSLNLYHLHADVLNINKHMH